MDGIGRRFSRLKCLRNFKGTLKECNYVPVVIVPLFVSTNQRCIIFHMVAYVVSV